MTESPISLFAEGMAFPIHAVNHIASCSAAVPPQSSPQMLLRIPIHHQQEAETFECAESRLIRQEKRLRVIQLKATGRQQLQANAQARSAFERSGSMTIARARMRAVASVGLAPCFSHFFMAGALRLVSFERGLYQPSRCKNRRVLNRDRGPSRHELCSESRQPLPRWGVRLVCV